MTGLRDYQLRAVDELRAAIAQHGSAVYCLPTGGGKTIVAAEIARRAAAKGSRTLLLVHRRELVRQAIDTLETAVPGVSVGVEAAGWPSIPWADLHVASVQTLVRRTETRVDPRLIIVDEAHHARAATWEAVLGRWPRAARIGLTATPQRLDGRGLGEHFASLISGPTIPELVESGHLAPSDTYSIPIIDTVRMRRDRNGEYMRAERDAAVTDKVIGDGARAYLRYARGRRTLFFATNRRHSRAVVDRLRAGGVRAEHVDGTDSTARRDAVFTGFRDGAIEVVSNVDLVSEGYDAPACDCVMMGGATASVTRYLQMAGRAMRPGPDKRAMILDLCGISHNLGLPDEVREWSLEDGEIATASNPGAQRSRTCKSCSLALPLTADVCPACASETTELPVEQEVTLEKAKPRKAKLARPQLNRMLREARLSHDPLASLAMIAESQGYRPGWVSHIARIWGLTG